ncbi:hypothetical protein [Marinomonas posidonica]|uniref:KfrA N-terminal DNA-binding domain-containing protein n=1 Tax=Marinomonas posidonica (strain CECT 7376 / NCIMB 14433 / IVIA-Po-181) TaxID=491952 RepID=F6D009_MARPP|nr:hypothetical protein [Marinomonas posidonica]AEF54749.1 hypothetical protein Mar181_1711 [Marinomonas posidonica IVIA-Po-181]
MARKANISRQEILQACWTLIDKHQYPNIPRVAQYFLDKDGRQCSNTTLLNAINQWQLDYDAHEKQIESNLNDRLATPINQFMREAAKQINQLIEEKAFDMEAGHKQKQSAIDSEYLSLSESLTTLEETHQELKEEHHSHQILTNRLSQENQYLEKRLNDVMSYNQQLKTQLEEALLANETLRLNLAQRELDLAKQDAHIQSLKQTHADELSRQQKEKQFTDQTNQQWQEIRDQLRSLNSSVNSLQDKDNDRGRRK